MMRADRDPNYAIDWYRVPVDAKTLAELNERSDIKGLLQSGGYLGLMLLSGFSAYYAWSQGAWGWMLLALWVHGTLTSFCINAVHELVHGTVFKTARLNTVFEWVFGFIGWNNPQGFWASHAEHHRFTLHDPHDLEVVAPARGSIRHMFKHGLINPKAILGTVKHHWRVARGVLGSEWAEHTLGGTERHKAVVRFSRALLIGHGLITVASLATGQWIIPVIVTLHLCYGDLVQQFINATQHDGMPDHVNDFRLNCRSVAINPVLGFLYWHMQYHIEHHMYAAVPCYNLKRLNAAIRHELPEPSRGLVGAWSEILGIQYRMDTDPGWRYMPSLPGDPASAPVPSTATVASPAQAAPAPAAVDGTDYTVWECEVCGFIYDEAAGLPEEGLAPGTRWTEIPEDWCCPDCGVTKAEFSMVERRADLATLN